MKSQPITISTPLWAEQPHHCLTIGELKKAIAKLPEDAEVEISFTKYTYTLILHALYFKENGACEWLEIEAR